MKKLIEKSPRREYHPTLLKWVVEGGDYSMRICADTIEQAIGYAQEHVRVPITCARSYGMAYLGDSPGLQ